MYAPIVRIVLRYGAGLIFGMEVGQVLAGDPDLVAVLVPLVTLAVTEISYWRAKRSGGAT